MKNVSDISFKKPNFLADKQLKETSRLEACATDWR
jgi:hypothetical protein